MICLRQSILNFPTRYARHMVGIADQHGAKAVLTKAAHEFLTELASFDEKIVDTGWLQNLEENGQGKDSRPRPSSGQEINAQQQKAARRRKQKTATMRRLRAKG